MKYIKFNNYKDVSSFYHRNKSEDSEYFLDLGIRIPIMNGLFFKQKNAIKEIKFYDEENGICKMILNKKYIDRFHPLKINNQKFWKEFKIKFPLVSVCGGESQSIEHCNENNTLLSKQHGFIDFIDKIIGENVNNKINFFEIGYGHGNIFNYYNDNVNYIGVDYYKNQNLNKFNNLLIIKESGIPKSIKNNSQDIIYCCNVLQHCCKHDRFEYFRQSFKKLKTGGYFLGSLFLETLENKDEYYWGMEDTKGRKYCCFFNQLTEVDTKEEFLEEINNIGFSLIKLDNIYNNNFSFILKK
jgi:hypothetical protein